MTVVPNQRYAFGGELEIDALEVPEVANGDALQLDRRVAGDWNRLVLHVEICFDHFALKLRPCVSFISLQRPDCAFRGTPAFPRACRRLRRGDRNDSPRE